MSNRLMSVAFDIPPSRSTSGLVASLMHDSASAYSYEIGNHVVRNLLYTALYLFVSVGRFDSVIQQTALKQG
jgi:hypothetical protein